jgi:signal transduction histidine kinase
MSPRRFLQSFQNRDGEERLAEREQCARLMLEQLPAIVSTFDTNLVFTSTHGAGLRALGLEESAFVGRALPDLVGENAPPVVSVRAALRGESSSNDYEFRGRWYENRAEPLRRRDGVIAGAINLGFDVTERRTATDAVRRLSAAAGRIQENERRRIARELHDELGQLLTSLRLDLGIVRCELRKAPAAAIEDRIDGMIDLVDLTIATVRRVATELRPAVLDDFGLRAALDQETARFAERTGIEVRLSISNDELSDVDRAAALYRILQESLTNVARHSGATLVQIRVDARRDGVEAELRDNGRGITEAEANGVATLGLLGLRERAWAFGGEAVIEAIPGGGTRVFVSLPR